MNFCYMLHYKDVIFVLKSNQKLVLFVLCLYKRLKLRLLCYEHGKYLTLSLI